MKLHGTYAYDEAFAATIATALNASYSDKASGHGYDKVFAHLFGGKTVDNFFEVFFFNDFNTQTLKSIKS